VNTVDPLTNPEKTLENDLARVVTALTERLAVLEADARHLRNKVAEQASQLASLETRAPVPNQADHERAETPPGEAERAMSRRHLLQRAGLAAAAGAGMAVTAAVAGAPAAAAGVDGDVVLGATNTASPPAQTVVSSDLAVGAALVGLNPNPGQQATAVYGRRSGASGLAGSGGVVGDTDSNTGAGVVGLNDAGVGVRGESRRTEGVFGRGPSAGVHGETISSTGGAGVLGTVNGVGSGVLGRHGGPAGLISVAGVMGDSADKYGVGGASIDSSGVYGVSGANSNLGATAGVWGETGVNGRAGVAGTARVGTNSSGVIGIYSGYSRDGATAVAGIAAVLGETNSDSNPAVAGFGKLTTAVYGQLGPWSGLTKPAAVVGDTDHSVFSAVSALNKTGIGLFAHGGRAPLLLDPAATTGAPTTGSHLRGELFMDGAGVLWICTADGTPGTWVQNLTSSDGGVFVPLTPARLLDTRASTPVGAGSANERVVQVTGSVGVPATAKAVAMNVTVTQPTADGGFITVYPDGVSRPGVSNLNFNAGQTIPNFAIVKLGTGGRLRIYNQSGTTHVLLDVAGYYA
jgi:hypothetical protein